MAAATDKLRKSLENYESFETQIERLEQEARAFLGEENCPPKSTWNDYEPWSEAWAKLEFLRRLRSVRAFIDRNDAAMVFELALELGALLGRFEVVFNYKPDIIRGAKVVKGAAEGGKKKSTRERDRALAIEWRERRAKALVTVSDTNLKVAVGRESEFSLKRETAIKAVNRGLLLLDQKTR